jgi:hypothetical protein
MAVSFEYMDKAKEAHKNILELYDHLPDGVIVLKPTKAPQE